MDDRCSVPFLRVCELLENISNLKAKQKQTLLREFYDRSTIGNFYPIVRLMVPAFDMERGQYGLREKTIAKYYTEVLNLPQKDRMALLNFKNPRKQLPGCPAGIFTDVLEFVIRSRVGESHKMQVDRVNELLDNLSNAIEQNQKKQVLAEFIRSMSSIEQKWLAKIILKDMKIGISESILNAYHPRALELFYNTNNLRDIFDKLKDRDSDIGVQMFQLHQPIKPMLAGRKTYGEIKKFLINLEVLVETKYDGERIQCHYSRDGNIKFFSRNAVDYTQLYGKSMRDVVLHNIVGVEACILDGELFAVDNETNTPLKFGKNKTVALEGETGGNHLMYVVFDILYIEQADGQKIDLMKRPLIERKSILESVLQDVPNRFEKLKYKQVKGSKAVFDIFNVAVERGDEGLIIKQLDSPYIPNDRSNHWLKMKSDYFEGMADTLDLLVVGGYFGRSNWASGKGDFDGIGVFLLAAASKVDHKNPQNSVFVPFTKVGTGYSQIELEDVRLRLKEKWKIFQKSPPYWRQWVPGIQERPDVFIENPQDSIIIELKAAEIVQTQKFPSGYTARFPIAKHIRYDKSWDMTTTITEITNMIENYSRGLTDKQHKIDIEQEQSGIQSVKRPRVQKRTLKDVIKSYQDTDTSNVVVKNKIFQGCIFYVSATGPYSKQELERIIVANSGQKVQNFMQGTTHVIAVSADSARISNLIHRHQINVIHPKWVIDCDKQMQLLPLRPRYVVHAGLELQQKFKEEFTDYGDSVYQPYKTVEDLLEVVDNYNVQVNYQQEWHYQLNPDEVFMLRDIRAYKLLGYTFYIHKVTCPDPALKVDYLYEFVEIKILALGGEVSAQLNEQVTHIMALDPYNNPTDFEIKTLEWLKSL